MQGRHDERRSQWPFSFPAHTHPQVWAVGPTLEACAMAANALGDTDPRLAPFVEGKGKRWAARCLVFGETCGRRKALTDLPRKVRYSHMTRL